MLSKERPDRKVLPHGVPEWLRDTPAFSLTICCQPRDLNQLAKDPTAINILQSVDYYREKHIWFPELMVLMPDHLHFIVAFSDQVQTDKTIKDWKRYGKRTFGIQWQDGFVDHRIRSEADHDEQWNYILNNPVKAGLVETIDDWPFKRIWKQW